MAIPTDGKFWFKLHLAAVAACLMLFAAAEPVLAAKPLDTLYDNQWYLKRIQAPEAWDLIHDSPDVIIAVIDTGVMITHPDLSANLWYNPGEIPGNKIDDDRNGYIDDVNGWDFVNNLADPTPKFKPGFTEDGINHGTIVAGLIAAQADNYSGIAGVTWNTQLMSLKALDDSGRANVKSVIRAINYAVANGAKIINLSFAGISSSIDLDRAMIRAQQKGVIVVAAGGNDGADGAGPNLDKKPLYPVCSGISAKRDNNLVIGVAATGPLDTKAAFSGFGRCIDISAPGVSIFSAAVYAPNYGHYQNRFDLYYDGYWSGTSFAVPLVSAALALMMQANPSLPPAKLIDLLLKSADNNYGVNEQFIGQLGQGRLNVLSAVRAALAAKEEETVSLLLFNDGENLGQIKVVTPKGVVKAKFNTFNKTQINAVAGDFNNDGRVEIAVAPRAGESPQIRIYSQGGELLKQFLAFEEDFHGGVNLAAADFDRDGFQELVAAPAGNHLSIVKVFDKNFRLKRSWAAYTPNFLNGVNLATGDINGDGQPEIVTAPAALGGSHIKVFSGQGKLLSQFVAFPSLLGGWRLAVADSFSNFPSTPHIVIAASGNQSPYVHFFTFTGELVKEFYAYNNVNGAIDVAAADFDHDGQTDIAVGASPGSGPRLTLYTGKGQPIKAFFTDKKTLTNGVNVATFK